jgi:F-type H+-transporting ATPase subunit delta
MRKAPLSVARRYARALLDVALEQHTAAPVEEALGQAARLFESQADLRRVLVHPALSPEKKKKVASSVWAQAPVLLQRFLALLLDRDRAAILPVVHAAYVELWNDHRGVVAAEAISATPLASGQVEALAAAAAKVAGRQVQLSTTVDPALLGGVVLRMDGRTYDGSLRAQLRALRMRLAPGSASSPTSPRV